MPALFRLVQQHQQLQQQQQQQPGARPNQTSPAEANRLQAEIQALKQRLQETGARSENELEQWRKVVEQEKGRADQNEKAAQEMHKRIQVRHCLPHSNSNADSFNTLAYFRQWTNNCNSKFNKFSSCRSK